MTRKVAGKTEETVGFDINILVKYRKVRNLRKIVKKVWVCCEHGEGFGMPRDSCIVDLHGAHIRELNKYNLRWNSAPGYS